MHQTLLRIVIASALVAPLAADDIDFNLDVRPILSNKCLLCHGPDPEGLQAGLRLDLREAAIAKLDSDETAIVPGHPEDSGLIDRIISEAEDIRMPPAEHGDALTAREVRILRDWIQQGAKYATHWAYVKPVRPESPKPAKPHAAWAKNAVDNFTLQQMQEHGLSPSEEADRHALVRRAFLDLTGLPPTVEEADAFAASTAPGAYENLVDDLLDRPTFGEHWARKWLDLARYADSAGYADDPSRTIWAYRDWVIRAINNNMPFDQFTKEQLAGDLLPDATESQLIATAFHRNTLTNNEGGTQDEEFRNVAVVDRVNTTMAVWMGTTMACAQCHTHKYDPITQEEYFRFFAIFNNTQDADRRNESPVLEIYTDDQKKKKSDLKAQVADLTKTIGKPTPKIAASQTKWEQRLAAQPEWTTLPVATASRKSEQEIKILDDGTVLVETDALESLPLKDTYTIEVPVKADQKIAAIRLSALPHESLPGNGVGHANGNFVITGVNAELAPSNSAAPQARFVRITNTGKKQILSLAEVQIFSDGKNIATQGKATQHSTAFGGPANLAIDGKTDGDFQNKSVTHTNTADNPWWEVDLGSVTSIDRVAVWNRTDNALHTRLNDFSIALLDEDREIVWTQQVATSPNPSAEFSPSNVRTIAFRTAFADYHQPNFEPADAVTGKTGTNDGWAVGGSTNKPHHLLLIPKKAQQVADNGTLRLTIEQNSPHSRHLIGHFGISTTDNNVAIQRSQLPAATLAILDTSADRRTPIQASALSAWYRENAAPELKTERSSLANAKKQLANMKPATSVPILREVMAKRRETHLQHRGNYLDKGQKVDVGLPAVFHAAPADKPIDRLLLAEWLTSEHNPLTARVLANRFWETLFGRGIVVTSEEFGSQGELPTHPQLLDWLATELHRNNWNMKDLIRTLVTSATYRQSSKVTPQSEAADPDNRWLSRGPRVRLSAEMVRDQALMAGGLLSSKMHGPPVKPPQPNLGLKAAFGSATDWKTSEGEETVTAAVCTPHGDEAIRTHRWQRSTPPIVKSARSAATERTHHCSLW